MRYQLSFSIFLFICLFVSCREVENPRTDFGRDYQPLEVGLFWIYEVEETIVFGENDSQTEEYFIRDVIEYSFFNVQEEEVFVVRRERSQDRSSWEQFSGYSLHFRGNALIRNLSNQKIVNLVLPVQVGRNWDAMVYNNLPSDIFEIAFMGDATVGEQFFQRSVKVLQEEDDDEITFRDNRYEIYARGVGMIEHYYEVFTYCSRNDCLGQMIKDSGRKTHLKLSTYGRI
ncbi:hypothetical protein [Cecembia lonarensis]|uniref:Lipoprotein n=1 Tax=Cecembia lonarensis (strain CCUG 58316 / KCTC 22772 / LW9) TaxID=1225176 RepID=K1LAX7_CECL9|nr:hypothetical protein [Cecembia lonarensis]EKB49407.1 hypothetical protein B879_01976 [Cecembia lonarensis LW9]